MIKIGILGDIGSGKSYVAQNFGYPVFNADNEVAKLYRTNKEIFKKLNRILPEYFVSFHRFGFPLKHDKTIGTQRNADGYKYQKWQADMK